MIPDETPIDGALCHSLPLKVTSLDSDIIVPGIYVGQASKLADVDMDLPPITPLETS